MKKILFTVENYYPNLSGVPIVVKYLAEGLCKKYEVHVVTRSFGVLSSYETYNGVHIHRFNIRANRLKKPSGDIDNYIRFIKNGHYDAIICECTQCVTTDVLLPYLHEISGIKILHSHGFSGLAMKPFKIMATIKNTVGNTVNYYIWKKYYDEIFPRYVYKFHSIICLSESDNDYYYLLDRGINPKILFNSAEESFFKSGYECTLKKYIPDLSDKYAICVAYYNDVKNQLGILSEFCKSKSCNNMDLVFIGTEKNDYYQKVQRLALKLQLLNSNIRVHLLVGVKRTDIPGAIGNASLYLCGSKREAFSISLIESMAVGTPFIGTNVGNTSTLPGGVVISDISEMHKAIDNLMADENKRELLKKNGRAFAYENCRSQKAIEEIIQIIETI